MKSTSGLVVSAADGIVGHVTRFLLGIPYWTVRYFVVDSGREHDNRELLVSPMLIADDERHFNVFVMRDAVMASPPYDRTRPVTRQDEAALLSHYALPWYWSGPSLWGPAATARDAGGGEIQRRVSMSRGPVHHGSAVQLADSEAVFGTMVTAADGEIGPVVDVLAQVDSWRVRYLVVDTSAWSFSRHALISPAWITQRAWPARRLTSRLTRQVIARAPQCPDVVALTREHEIALHRYYGMPPYWQTRAQG